MNREELIEKLEILYDEPWNDVEEYFELVADLVLGNEKQPETQRVTAKEVYLALTANIPLLEIDWDVLNKYAQNGAEAFNNYNPESHE